MDRSKRTRQSSDADGDVVSRERFQLKQGDCRNAGEAMASDVVR